MTTTNKIKLSDTQSDAISLASKLYDLAYEMNRARAAVFEGAPCRATFEAARLTLVAAFGDTMADALHERVTRTDEFGQWSLTGFAREAIAERTARREA